MSQTAVAAPDAFEDLFQFIDRMPVAQLAWLTAQLFGLESSFTTGPDDLDPCGECRKGLCDHCAGCLFHESFA